MWKEEVHRPCKGIEKKLWNMKVTIISIVIGAFGTVTKGLLKGLEDLEVGGRVETIQTSSMLRTARILLRFLGVSWCKKKLSWVNNNNNNNNNNKNNNICIYRILLDFETQMYHKIPSKWLT